MIDQDTRAAILKLHQQGHGKHKIAKTLGISSSTVKLVIDSGKAEVPAMRRRHSLSQMQDKILELHGICRGNLVRVHEELQAEVPGVAYQTLTEFCRKHGIGKKVKPPAGTYEFPPGVEMQHDTSPHRVKIGEREVLLQCATLVLGFSRMIYGQVYLRWTRLTSRTFLTQALQYFGGAAGRCVIDNSNVILLHGTGPDAVPTPEMKAFGDRFGFQFLAHKLRDPNRKGKVERPYQFIEGNFYPARTFADLADCNQQFVQWCDKQNGAFKAHLRARPIDLFAQERLHLKPLPVHVPEIFHTVSRKVDLEGWVHLDGNRYSAPDKLIGEQVEVREYVDKLRIFQGPRVVCEHPLLPLGAHAKQRLPEHAFDYAAAHARKGLPLAEEVRLRQEDSALHSYIDGMKKHHVGRAGQAIKRLLRMWQELPQESVLTAVREAEHYGMYDLHRLEKMVLGRVAGDFFQLKVEMDNGGDPK